MRKFLLASLLFIAAVSVAFSQQTKLTVAPDGSGDYRTVQEALNAVPSSNRTLVTIFIKKGIYKEKLALQSGNVKLLGEDRDATVLTYDDYKGRVVGSSEPMPTIDTATLRVYGADVIVENLTLENTAGPSRQAVAAWVKGDRVQFRNCRFLGFKDTLYLTDYNSRHYFKNCYIEGSSDFITGSNTAYFDDCTLYCKPGGTCIAAASTSEAAAYGFVFRGCKIVGNAPDDSYFLGRPWKPYAKTVFIDCEMSAVIKAVGWDERGKDVNKQDAFYAEYKSTGPGAAPKKRVLWSHQLTPEQVVLYNRELVLRGWKAQE